MLHPCIFFYFCETDFCITFFKYFTEWNISVTFKKIIINSNTSVKCFFTTPLLFLCLCRFFCNKKRRLHIHDIPSCQKKSPWIIRLFLFSSVCPLKYFSLNIFVTFYSHSFFFCNIKYSCFSLFRQEFLQNLIVSFWQILTISPISGQIKTGSRGFPIFRFWFTEKQCSYGLLFLKFTVFWMVCVMLYP